MEASDPNATCNPIFLVGIWRSGTSLLASLLNQHPEIALMYECAVLDFPRPLEKMRMKGDWLRRQEFFNQALSRHRLIFGGSPRGLEQMGVPEDLYKAYAGCKGAARWGEKAPTYARRLRMLMEKYPQSSIILIWRDLDEIMRSVRQAGKEVRYFRRPGILTRVLGHHERMLSDAAVLEQRGHRLLHVDYEKLVADTGGTMRRICDFLEVEFHPRMASLEGADFTSLIQSPIHNRLRKGVIVRQESNPALPAKLTAKLARFRNRALRLRGLAERCADEPLALELLRMRLASGFWFAYDSTKRVLFEFLPLPWLRSYRSLKAVFTVRNAGLARITRRELAGHLATIIACYGILALNFWLKYTRPNLVLMPLSLLSCTALTLVLNRRWGLFAAGAAAFTVPLAQWFGDTDYASPGMLAWNFVMRFTVLASFIFLLDAARAHAATRNQAAGQERGG